MNLKERAGLVATVSSALTRGEHTLTVLPGLIKRLLEEDAWREFETKLGQHITYEHFEDFVVTPPLNGLGASMDLVRRIISDDPVAYDLLDQTLQQPHGGDRKSEEVQREIKGMVQSLDLPEKRDRSTQLLRRLRKDFPELHEQVMRNEKTAHAAAVEAKIYPPRVNINLDNPESAAASLLAKASPEFLEELQKLLTERKQS